MKRRLGILLGILLLVLPISTNADINSNLTIAKQYEGNFYKYHTSGDWYIFSDLGVSLGDIVPLSESVDISYYVNPDEGYVIQYYKDDNNMSYAVWYNDTVESLSCSKY